MPNEFVHVREIRTPEGLTTRVYADGVGVSSSPLDSTLDVVVGSLREERRLPDGQRVNVLPEEVVSRIRVNPSLVWHIARTLTDAMPDYEELFGDMRFH